jgi:hypothetical protein
MGRHIDLKGYVVFYQRGQWTKEHRLVWEREHNACLLDWADVHHKDHNKANNVWYNLQAMMHWQHSILENKIDMTGRFCVECGSTKTTHKKGVPNWYKADKGFRCFICWRRNKRREKRYH